MQFPHWLMVAGTVFWMAIGFGGLSLRGRLVEIGAEGESQIAAQGNLMVVKSDFKVGDRVQLSELGRSRYRKPSRTGTVTKIPKPASGGGAIEVLFDGNKQASRIHRSYIEVLCAE
jgi:hypothetical protein